MSKTTSTSDPVSNATSPVKALLAAGIKHWEQCSQWQLASSQVYCDIGFEQLRKMTAISNIDQAQAFTWNPIEPVSAINKQLLSDWQTWVTLHNQCKNDLRAAFSSKPAAADTPASKKKAQPAAKTTSKTKLNNPPASQPDKPAS